MRATALRLGPPALLLAALLLSWEAAVRSVTALQAIPSPVAVLSSLVTDSNFYLENGGATLGIAVLGLATSVGLSVAVASLFALARGVHHTVMPLVVLSQTVPLVAVAPVLALVIGDGLLSRVLVTSWLCWFPLVVGLTHGLLNVDRHHLAVFDSLGASRWQVFTKLRAPSSAPSMVAAVRAAAGFAMIGAIVVEYSGAPVGLGAFIMGQVIAPSDATRLYGCVVVAAALGWVLTESAHAITRAALTPWLRR